MIYICNMWTIVNHIKTSIRFKILSFIKKKQYNVPQLIPRLKKCIRQRCVINV